MNPTHQLWLLLLTVAVTGSQDLTDTEPDSKEETVPESTLSSSDEIPEKPKVQLRESNGNVHSESDAVDDSQPVNAASGDPADKHSGSPELNGNVHSESDAVNDSQPGNAASGDPADKHSGSPARCVKPSGDGILSVSDPESGEYYASGESVTLQCDAGYYPPSRPVTCGAGGRWNVPARCVAQCAKPTGPGISSISLYPSNGYTHTSYQEYYNRENKILVQCQTGYYPLSRTYTCQGSGSGSDWDRPVSCTAQCTKPTGPGISSINLYTSNGYINTNNQEYYNRENQIRVQCQTGYYPLSSTYTCQDRGSGSDWDSPVSCIAQCAKPTGPGIYSISLYPSNGYSHTSNREYYYRENKILVQCQTGYYPSSSTYTCQGSGSDSDWDRPVSCTAQCAKPTGPGISSIRLYTSNGYINTNNQEYYNRTDQITVWCQTGYYPSSRSYTCQDKGSSSDWDSPVSCIALCKTPTGRGIDTIRKHPPNYDQNYYRGNKILVRCQTGYYPSSSTYTCQGSGSGSDWDSPVSCIAQCAKPTGPGISSISLYTSNGYSHTSYQEYYHRENKILVRCKTGYYPLYSTYTCQDTGSGSDWDRPVSCTVPDKPMITKPTGENVIKWTLSSSRGAITGYEMNVSAQRDYNKSFTETGSYWFPPNITQFKLEMKNGTNYTIYLRGFTPDGAGKPTQWSHETPIADPPVPLQKVLSIGVTTAELELHPMPDINGPISSYEVIIFAKNGDNSSDPCDGYTSTHYNSSSSPRLYTAALLPAHNLTEPTTLILGDGRRNSDFFNAPLHAGQRYSVSVRVTSAWREVEKSSCAVVGDFVLGGSRNNPSTYLLVSIAVKSLLVALLPLVFVFFALRRKCRTERRE